MSLAEYTRAQKKIARVSKRNLETYLENAEGILTPQEIEDASKPAIDAFSKTELNTGTKLSREEAFNNSKNSLTEKINKLTTNDQVVTDYIISGLTEDEIMNIETVYDEFISGYLLKYGKTQKTKDFFVQSIKAFLNKEYKDMKLFTDYNNLTNEQQNILDRKRQEYEQSVLDEEARNQATIDSIEQTNRDNQAISQQLEADRLAEEARQQAEVQRKQAVQDKLDYEKRSKDITSNVNKSITTIESNLAKKLKSNADGELSLMTSVVDFQKLIQEHENIEEDVKTVVTSKQRKNLVDQDRLDKFYKCFQSPQLAKLIKKIDNTIDLSKGYSTVTSRQTWINENFFYLLPKPMANKFIDKCLNDFNFGESDFLELVQTKKGRATVQLISDIDFDVYKNLHKDDLLEIIKSISTGTSKVDKDALDKIEAEIIKQATKDRTKLDKYNNTLEILEKEFEDAYNFIDNKYNIVVSGVINQKTKRGDVDINDVEQLAKAIMYNNNKFDVQNTFINHYDKLLQKSLSKSDYSFFVDYINYLNDSTNLLTFDDIKTILTSSSASSSSASASASRRPSTPPIAPSTPTPNLSSIYPSTPPIAPSTSTPPIAPSVPTPPTPTIGGVGLKSSKQRVGKGSILTDINHPLLYIDKKLLDNNMLSVKYKKNGNSHPKFKTVYISDDLKHAILKNNHNMKLEARENQILKNLILLIGSDKEKEPFKKDDDFNQKFKILLGQLRAGNDSKILRQELKQYILAGLQSNKLSRSVALDLMVELND